MKKLLLLVILFVCIACGGAQTTTDTNKVAEEPSTTNETLATEKTPETTPEQEVVKKDLPFPKGLLGTWENDTYILTISENLLSWDNNAEPVLHYEGTYFEYSEADNGFLAFKITKGSSGGYDLAENLKDQYYAIYVKDIKEDSIDVHIPFGNGYASKDLLHHKHESVKEWWNSKIFTRKK